MEEGKIVHIINTIMFFILASFFGYLSIQMIGGAFTNPAIPLYLGLLGAICLLFSLIVFILYIKSFRSINLNNNYFKISFILNLFVLLTLVSNVFIFLFSLRGLVVLPLFLFAGATSLIIFIVSIIIFLVGYNKNKLNKMAKKDR
jgi:hypothetical protein